MLMKHYFTLIIGLFITLTTQAQTFEFQYQGLSIADDATITIAAEEDVFGELSCETNPTDNPTNGLMLKLLSGPAIEVSSSLDIQENTMDAQAQWCMGGECTPFSPLFPSLYKTFTLSNETQVQFDAKNISHTGHLKAQLVVWTEEEEAHYVNIVFTYGEPSAISSIPVPDDGQQTYYTISGSRVDKPGKGLYISRNRKVIIR